MGLGREREGGHAFEVGHEGLSPGVEGIYDHLPIGRTGDLDPSVLETRGRGCADPRTFGADASGLGGEVEFAAIIELLLNGLSGLEEGLTRGVESSVEGSQELDGIVSQDLCLSLRGNGGKDLDAFYSHERVGKVIVVGMSVRGLSLPPDVGFHVSVQFDSRSRSGTPPFVEDTSSLDAEVVDLSSENVST